MTSRPGSTAAVQPSAQVANFLRGLIASGELAPGARIPPARELAEQQGVALTTAVRAVEQLRGEGLVETVHGRGSYVRVPPNEFVRMGFPRYRRHPEGLAPNRDESARGGYLDEIDHGHRDTEAATPALAERLGISVGDPLSVVRYRWLTGGRPTQVSTQWEPLELTAGTAAEHPSSAQRGRPSVIARFDEIGLHVTEVVEEIRTRLPTDEERAMLEMPPDTPVLHVIRTHWAGDTAVETADIVIRGDRTVLRIEHPVGE